MEPRDYIDPATFKWQPFRSKTSQRRYADHKIERAPNMFNSNSVYDAMFSATNVKYLRRGDKRHGYDRPADQSEYGKWQR